MRFSNLARVCALALAAAGAGIAAESALRVSAVAAAPAPAPAPALAQAVATFAGIADYRSTVSVHETDGQRTEDRTYRLFFKRPRLERVDVLAGPGKGGGIVWLGGDKVKGHHGGILSGIKLTFDLHDHQVMTLRGDSVDGATIAAMLADFEAGRGAIAETPGPQLEGAGSTAVSLAVGDPSTFNGVTREVLYLSQATHLPVRRERFVGTQLVKSERIMELTTNVGLTTADFPW